METAFSLALLPMSIGEGNSSLCTWRVVASPEQWIESQRQGEDQGRHKLSEQINKGIWIDLIIFVVKPDIAQMMKSTILTLFKFHTRIGTAAPETLLGAENQFCSYKIDNVIYIQSGSLLRVLRKEVGYEYVCFFLLTGNRNVEKICRELCISV